MKGPRAGNREASRLLLLGTPHDCPAPCAPGESHLGDSGVRESRGLRCRRSGVAEKRADEEAASGRHVTWAAAQAGLPPPLSSSPLPSPPLRSPARPSPRPARRARSSSASVLARRARRTPRSPGRGCRSAVTTTTTTPPQVPRLP